MDKLRFGKVIGRGHILSGKNCQDVLSISTFEAHGEKYSIAVICDGCGEGAYSEVGAGLTGKYLVERISSLVNFFMPVRLIPDILFKGTIAFLGGILAGFPTSNPTKRVDIVKNYLLFTVLGFIHSEATTSVFVYGDGLMVANQEIIEFRQGESPYYLGYHLVEKKFLEKEVSNLPSGFTQFIFDSGKLTRLAIGSDAWFSEKDLLEQVWGISHPNGLQRKMNLWSQKAHRFYDDATIVVLEEE